ncbi:hypothetical protein D9M71_159670 [compost metagenome]
MAAELPVFKYFPALPGYISESESVCCCCSEKRGYIYDGGIYSRQDVGDGICPWCIADGSAACRFDGSFHCEENLRQAGLAQSVVEEIAFRTPGYPSWQESLWMVHCKDGCEFHGDASLEDIRNASPATRQEWQACFQMSESEWQWATKDYQPGGDVCFYKFICRHCRLVVLGWEMS